MGRIIGQLIQLFTYAMFGRIILSWFPISPGSPLATVFSVLYTITEPVLGPVRRALPPMAIGGMGFDFSPIIVIIGLRILGNILVGG